MNVIIVIIIFFLIIIINFGLLLCLDLLRYLIIVF